MMKFLLVMEQDNGCDYTLRCGVDFAEIEAPDRKSAIAVSFEKMMEVHGEPPDYMNENIARADLYELAGEKITIPLDKFRLELEHSNEVQRLKVETAKEKGEYERLRAKYGDKRE